MNNSTQLLQDDIKNFILSDYSISHRTHLLNEILEDYFETLDDDMIQKYEDYMFPIMEVLNNDGEDNAPIIINLPEGTNLTRVIRSDDDYAECVDTLVDNMKSTK